MPRALGASLTGTLRTMAGTGWNEELQDLDVETTNLLAAVRGDDKKKKRRGRGPTTAFEVSGSSTPGGGTRKLGTTKRTKADHSKSMPSLEGQAAKKKQLPGRQSIEVLGDESPPSTARSAASLAPGSFFSSSSFSSNDKNDTAGTKSGATADGSVVAKNEEEEGVDPAVRKHREMESLAFNFAAREAAARGGYESFVPQLNVRLKDLEAERARLARIDARLATVEVTKAYARVEKAARKESLRKDGAATDIERCFRGRLGRRRTAMRAEEVALEAEVQKRWVEVRDRGSGETWYFNTLTHVSRWTLPAALVGVVATEHDAVTLPPIRQSDDDDPATASQQHQQHQQQQQQQRALPPLLKTTSNKAKKRGAPPPLVPKRLHPTPSTEDLTLMRTSSFSDVQFAARRSQAGAERRPVSASFDSPAADDDDDDHHHHQGDASSSPPPTSPPPTSPPPGPPKVLDVGEVRYPEEPLPGTSLYAGEGDAEALELMTRRQEDAQRARKRDGAPDAKSFVLPDGSMSKMQLRSAVQNLLRTHKFDSVAALTRSSAEKRAAAQAPGDPSFLDETVVTGAWAQDIRENPFDPTQRHAYMSAMPLLEARAEASSSSPSKKRIAGAPNQLSRLNLALRDYPHDGFERQQQQQQPPPPREVGGDPPLPGDSESIASFDADVTTRAFFAPAAVRKICFNCWSAGAANCALHDGDAVDEDGNAKDRPHSILMCQNWDLGEIERRYRSEDIQEAEHAQVSSLRYNKATRQFTSTMELKHPIYRKSLKLVEGFNFTSMRKWHQHAWVLSLVEILRCNKIKTDAAKKSAGVLKVRNSMLNHSAVVSCTKKFIDSQPKPPVTGTSLPERRGEVVYLERRKILEGEVANLEQNDENNEFVYVRCAPVPFPVALFEPAMYSLPAPRTVPMPLPSYAADVYQYSQNTHLDPLARAAWFERFCSSAVRDARNAALETIKAVSPVSGMDLLRRSKYPAPHTIKFSTLARKPTAGLLAVGGLAAELMISQLVQAVVPPQYGNFTVMERLSIVPERSPEISATLASFRCPPVTALFVTTRPLQHPLNVRQAPTITITCFARRNERHYYGTNRPAQTGEEGDLGFRTSTHAAGYDSIVIFGTELMKFTPSADVATANAAATTPTTTTRVDHTYPFCQPSARPNTTLDFYHLLLTDLCTPNKEQVFTNLSVQECGDFMRRVDATKPLGTCVSLVYRSWAFIQRQPYEEYETDDGVPYWYDRRSGATMWERPLATEELKTITEGGIRVDADCNDTKDMRVPDARPTREVRKLMLRHHERDDELEIRRKTAAFSISDMKAKGHAMPHQPVRKTTETPSSSFMEASQHSGKPPPVKISKTPYYAAPPPTVATPADSTPASRGGPPPPAAAASAASSQRPRTPNMNTPMRTPNAQRNNSPNKRRGSTMMPDGAPPTSQSAPPSSSEPMMVGEGGLQRDAAEALAAKIAAALMPTLEGSNATASDLLKLGLGLGLGLAQKNADLFSQQQQQQQEEEGPSVEEVDDFEEILSPHPTQTQGSSAMGDVGPAGRMGPAQVASAERARDRAQRLGIPIGVPGATAAAPEAYELPHDDEEGQRRRYADQLGAGQSTSEMFQGTEVITEGAAPPDDSVEEEGSPASYGGGPARRPVDLTSPPDEVAPKPVSFLADKKEDVERTLPVVVHPELMVRGYMTHGVAGEGTAFVKKGGLEARAFIGAINSKSDGSLLRRAAEPIPEGFMNAIHATHVAPARVDYLPWVPNLPLARPIGRIKPRPAAEDWLAVGFDPWSAGKEPLHSEFVGALSTKAESGILDHAPKAPDDSFIQILDEQGLGQQAEEAAQANKLAEDFAQLASWARHSKYREIENAMNQPDFLLPIDYQDATGNTLLSVAVQNGNKRIAKMCLRRGATVNLANNTGQTVLHFAYAYGFEDLGEYLKSKGADDRPRNADGLTCYEGLSQAAIDQI